MPDRALRFAQSLLEVSQGENPFEVCFTDSQPVEKIVAALESLGCKVEPMRKHNFFVVHVPQSKSPGAG
jgi:hypothetical protein